jgi:DNA primase
VLLLPEGEDPDSFAQKKDSDQLLGYIKEHETDFIRFKTNLLMKETRDDPVGRAQLVQDIVRSISVIPDSIIRTEYVKECSSLMKVEEQLLFTEIGKLRKKKLEKDRNKNSFRQQKTETASQPVSRETTQAPISSSNPFDNEEKEVLRFLLKYGNCSLGETETEEGVKEVTVGEYIVSELRQDDLESVNPLYNKLMQLYEENHQEPGFEPSAFFVASTDTEVSRLATDLIAKEYSLSRIHSKNGEVATEEDLLENLVPKVVTELKWRKVKVLLEEKRHQLKKAEEEKNEEHFMHLLEEINNLQQAFKYISKALGERTVV